MISRFAGKGVRARRLIKLFFRSESPIFNLLSVFVQKLDQPGGNWEISTISLILPCTSSSSSTSNWVLGRTIIPDLATSRIPNGSTSFKNADMREGLAHNSMIQLDSAMSTTFPPKFDVKLEMSFKCSCFNLNTWDRGKLEG